MARKGRFPVISLLLLTVAAVTALLAYRYFFKGIDLDGRTYIYFYVGSKDDLEDVTSRLEDAHVIDDLRSFEWLAGKMKLGENLHPGKYRITRGMTVRQVINLIKYNKQEKVKLSINSQIQTAARFSEYLGEKLELEPHEVQALLEDGEWLNEHFGVTPEAAFAVVVPGTYEVEWTTPPAGIMKILEKKYRQIWTPWRKKQASRIGLSPSEVITLASICQSESSIRTEQEKIAGVYINRLKKGMMLQADPTLRFANGIFGAQRFWDSDKETDSPYNTYRFKGLPPGPICVVYPSAIDAVLNYAHHRYYYFCARPELNGYSDFSETYAQHEKFAAAYRRAMNSRGISR